MPNTTKPIKCAKHYKNYWARHSKLDERWRNRCQRTSSARICSKKQYFDARLLHSEEVVAVQNTVFDKAALFNQPHELDFAVSGLISVVADDKNTVNFQRLKKSAEKISRQCGTKMSHPNEHKVSAIPATIHDDSHILSVSTPHGSDTVTLHGPASEKTTTGNEPANFGAFVALLYNVK